MQRVRFRRSDPVQNERLLLRLYELDVLGISEDDDEFQAFFPDELDAELIFAEQRSLMLGVEPVGLQIEEGTPSPQSWTGFCVGEHFFVGPSVPQEAVPPGRLHLRVDATQAFGTGRHETTQLMLEILEKEVGRGQCVVDVGSGSGILSQAASRLGVTDVVCCDIDEVAVVQGRATSDALAFVGSVDALQRETADLLLVNISARVIDDLAAQLKRVLKPSGLLVASGFIDERVPQKLIPHAVTERDDWQCWICRREGIVVADADADRVLQHAPVWW